MVTTVIAPRVLQLHQTPVILRRVSLTPGGMADTIVGTDAFQQEQLLIGDYHQQLMVGCHG